MNTFRILSLVGFLQTLGAFTPLHGQAIDQPGRKITVAPMPVALPPEANEDQPPKIVINRAATPVPLPPEDDHGQPPGKIIHRAATPVSPHDSIDKFGHKVAAMALVAGVVNADGKVAVDKTLSSESVAQVTAFYAPGINITDEQLASFSAFVNLRNLDLSHTLITDRGLVYLKSNTLQHLYLAGTAVTNAGLAQLRGQQALETLDVRGTRITDDGVAELKHLKKLQVLDLEQTAVTDRSLTILAGMPSLKVVIIGRNQITEDARSRFLAARPDCRLLWRQPIKPQPTLSEPAPSMPRGALKDQRARLQQAINTLEVEITALEKQVAIAEEAARYFRKENNQTMAGYYSGMVIGLSRQMVSKSQKKVELVEQVIDLDRQIAAGEK